MSTENKELKFTHLPEITDIKLFKHNKKLEQTKNWDDIISELVLLHKKADEELKEIIKMCDKENG